MLLFGIMWVIGDNTRIGDGTRIGSFCDVGRNVVIGKNCIIQAHVTISNGCEIGDNVFIGPNSSLLNDKFPHSGCLTLARISVEKMVKNGFKCVFAYLGLLWTPLMSVS